MKPHYQSYYRKQYYLNKPKDARKEEKDCFVKNLEERIGKVESRMDLLQKKYQELHDTTIASLEEVNIKLDLMKGKFAKEAIKKISNFQNMNFSELKELGNVIDELKIAIEYYKEIKKSTRSVDEKGEINANSKSNLTIISSHSNFIMDDGDRAIVYVKSKILSGGKRPKAAFGIWWAAGHTGNSYRVVEDFAAKDENDVNLHAFICVMETAIRYKVQRLCIVADTKHIIDRMIDAQLKMNKSDVPWKVFSARPTDQENLFHYICDMTTWFYDIKWLYVEESSKMPGLIDASKLIK